jgi:prepilin-type N-terminal cleavage/methylation domain-containing protein
MLASTLKKSCKSVRGFTLVELAVSVAIMTIIFTISLSSGPEVSTRIALADEAYRSELLIREAQLQGSAVNSFGGIYGGVGVYFDRDITKSKEVLKFKDRVDPAIVSKIGIGDGIYNVVPMDEKESILTLSKKNKIGKLCVATSTNPLMCNDDVLNPTTLLPLASLTISFIRPKQLANIYVNGDTAFKYDKACIQFDSVKSPIPGYVRSVLVYKTGMITKKSGTCN